MKHAHSNVITRPTRFSSTATLIDNIFVNSLIGNYESGIFVSDISDHLPIFYIAQDKINNPSFPKHIVKTYRDINDDAIASFVMQMKNTSWDTVVAPDK